MIVVIGGIKGGVGKTTTAVNLAVMRSKERDVLLIDADQQGSATDFTAVRNDTVEGGSGYTAVQLFGRAVRTDGLTLSTKYEDVIIDVGGRDTSSQRSALTIADKLILPVLPSSFDIWSLGPLHTLLEEIFPVNEKLEVLAFINRADARGSDNEEAKELASENSHLKVIEVQIGNRKSFRSAAAKGLAVTELKPEDEKASSEIKKLYHYIFNTESTLKK